MRSQNKKERIVYPRARLWSYASILFKTSVLLLLLGALLRRDISGDAIDSLERTVSGIGRAAITLGYGVFLVSVLLFLLGWLMERKTEK